MTATTCVVLSPLAIAGTPAHADARETAQIRVVSPQTAAAEGWLAQAYENTDAGEYTDPDQTVELVPDAPLGEGARFLHMGQYSVQTELFRTGNFDGLPVADISRLDYSTWAKASGSRTAAKQPAYLRLSISSNGSGTNDTTLNFEPAENGAQGAVQQATWQDWETAAGRWHVVTGPGVTAGSYLTLAEYRAAQPNAGLATNTEGGALSIMAGSAGANQTYAKLGFDRIAAEVGDQTYLWDLEPDGSKSSAAVTEVDTASDAWNTSAYDYSGEGSTTAVRQSFAVGPKVPPRGKGSLQMTVGNNSAATQFFRSTVLDGKQVDELRRLRYSTYAEKLEGAGATPQQPPYLRLSISSTGSGTKDTTLNFEPANNSAQAPVANGEWQTWDAFDGRFRVVEGPGETAGDSPASFITLAAYMTRHPQATFAPNPKDFGGEGALAFVVGSSGDNQRNAKFAIDDISIGTSETIEGTPGTSIRTYDLEGKYTVPTVTPAKRIGAGPVPLTGTAGAGDKVEIRTPGTDGDFSRLAGTATADENGKWTFQLPRITQRTMVRAWLAGTYGTTEIHSTSAQVDVAFLVTLALETKDGYTIGRTTVDPVVAGVPIVWERYLNKKWTKVLQSKTNARGGAVFKWNTVQGTGYVLRARAAGTDTVLEGLSKTQTIRSS